MLFSCRKNVKNKFFQLFSASCILCTPNSSCVLFHSQMRIALVPRTSDNLEVAGCSSPGGRVYVCECLQLECGDMQSLGCWPVSTHTTMGGPGQSLGRLRTYSALFSTDSTKFFYIVYELNTNSYFLWQCKTILSLLIPQCGPHLVCQCALRPGLRPLVPVFSPARPARHISL